MNKRGSIFEASKKKSNQQLFLYQQQMKRTAVFSQFKLIISDQLLIEMGHKCCRPELNGQPKYPTLLGLAYQEASQFRHSGPTPSLTTYEALIGVLAKKGYVKSLCQYLSSHVHFINPVLYECKGRQASVRNKEADMRIKYAIVSLQICSKIWKLAEDLKSKMAEYNNNESNMKASLQTSNSFIDQEVRNSQFSKVPDSYLSSSNANKLSKSWQPPPNSQRSRSKNKRQKKGTRKAHFNEQKINLLSQEFKQNIYGISVEILRDAGLSFTNLSKDAISHPLKTKDQIFETLLKMLIQITKSEKNADHQTKTDPRIIKSLLDELMKVLEDYQMMKKDPLIDSPYQSQHKGSIISLKVVPEMVDTKSSQQEISTLTSSKISLLALTNYKTILQRQALNLSNINMYKQIVRQHMPQLLDYWAMELIEFTYNCRPPSDSTIMDMHLDSKYHSSQKTKRLLSNGQLEIKMKEEEQIEAIMLEFFNSYFSYKESEYIYQQLLSIFDRLNFKRKLISPIEQLLFRALSTFELKDQIISKWFEYVIDHLAYLGVHAFNRTRAEHSFQMVPSPATVKKASNSKFIKRNSLKMDYNYYAAEQNYLQEIDFPCNFYYFKLESSNSADLQSKVIGCLKTIKKWIMCGHIELSAVLKYKSQKFFLSILVNLSRDSSAIRKQIHKLLEDLIFIDTRAYVSLVDNAILLIKLLKVDIENVIRRISLACRHSSGSSHQFGSQPPPRTIFKSLSNSFIIEELVSLYQGTMRPAISTRKDKKIEHERVWEKFEEERSYSSSSQSKNSSNKIKSKKKVPPPLAHAGNPKLQEIKKGYQLSQKSLDMVNGPGILPAEELIQQIITMVSRSYFKDVRKYRQYRISHSPLVRGNYTSNMKEIEEVLEEDSEQHEEKRSPGQLRMKKAQEVRLEGSGGRKRMEEEVEEQEYNYFNFSKKDYHQLLGLIFKKTNLQPDIQETRRDNKSHELGSYKLNNIYLIHLTGKIVSQTGILGPNVLVDSGDTTIYDSNELMRRISRYMAHLNQESIHLWGAYNQMHKVAKDSLGLKDKARGFQSSSSDKSQDLGAIDVQILSLLSIETIRTSIFPALIQSLFKFSMSADFLDENNGDWRDPHSTLPHTPTTPQNEALQSQAAGRRSQILTHKVMTEIILKLHFKDLLKYSLDESAADWNAVNELTDLITGKDYLLIANRYLIIQLFEFLIQCYDVCRKAKREKQLEEMSQVKKNNDTRRKDQFNKSGAVEKLRKMMQAKEEKEDELMGKVTECQWLFEEHLVDQIEVGAVESQSSIIRVSKATMSGKDTTTNQFDGNFQKKSPLSSKRKRRPSESLPVATFPKDSDSSSSQAGERRLNELLEEMFTEKSKELMIDICDQALSLFKNNPSLQLGFRNKSGALKRTSKIINKSVFNRPEEDQSSASSLPVNSTRYKIMKFFNLVPQQQAITHDEFLLNHISSMEQLKAYSSLTPANEEKIIPLVVNIQSQYYRQRKAYREEPHKSFEESEADSEINPMRKSKQRGSGLNSMIFEGGDFECKASVANSSNMMAESHEESFMNVVNAARKS